MNFSLTAQKEITNTVKKQEKRIKGGLIKSDLFQMSIWKYKYLYKVEISKYDSLTLSKEKYRTS